MIYMARCGCQKKKLYTAYLIFRERSIGCIREDEYRPERAYSTAAMALSRLSIADETRFVLLCRSERLAGVNHEILLEVAIMLHLVTISYFQYFQKNPCVKYGEVLTSQVSTREHSKLHPIVTSRSLNANLNEEFPAAAI